LEIPSNSTFEEAKAAYRDLAQVWHPDKHSHNERIREKATQKFKDINAAWSELEIYFQALKEDSATKTEQEREDADRMATDAQHRQYTDKQDEHQKAEKNNNNYSTITCPACNTKYKFPFGKFVTNGKCGKCGSLLSIAKEQQIRKSAMQKWQAVIIAVIMLIILSVLNSYIAIAIVIITTVWAALDASKIGAKYYNSKASPGSVVIGCLLLWIVVLPWYLYVRSQIKAGVVLRGSCTDPFDIAPEQDSLNR
jgi:RNase P subunit RPR2